jgi:hypothetical protein
MEDFKIILYILAIIAYFIYTAWRKAFKTPDDDLPRPAAQDRPKRERPIPRPLPTPTPQPRQQRPAAPATSFEDILREMQSKMERANEQARKRPETPKPTYQPTPEPVSAERMPARALSLEIPEQARMYEQQAKARSVAATADAPIKQREYAEPSRYAALLRNPQTAREAFILSEIFNRKQY